MNKNEKFPQKFVIFVKIFPVIEIVRMEKSREKKTSSKKWWSVGIIEILAFQNFVRNEEQGQKGDGVGKAKKK